MYLCVWSHTPPHAHTHTRIHTCIPPQTLLTTSVCLSPSDHPGHCGGCHHSPPHLPQKESSHRHRPHQGVKQVRAHTHTHSYTHTHTHIHSWVQSRHTESSLSSRKRRVITEISGTYHKYLTFLWWAPRSDQSNKNTDWKHTFRRGRGLIFVLIIHRYVDVNNIWLTEPTVFLHRAVGHVMSSLFYPLLTFALLALVIAYWGITAVYPSTCQSCLWSCLL